ncbi:hypothetical protein HYDPIDRAFT_29743 [Hydnomerulius pinastri MD-312]|uniref:Heterokaryon incompatibility domain-containing protein n=1 Tax=Hydnomerulius pinastri MD-312 TaxID=994086 RepID=A0A0C9VXR0_9AGAM|nr:hypothetical protein HYDPIDRAFT_29743 [Hydnomerulius pinastri MD-312]
MLEGTPSSLKLAHLVLAAFTAVFVSIFIRNAFKNWTLWPCKAEWVMKFWPGKGRKRKEEKFSPPSKLPSYEQPEGPTLAEEIFDILTQRVYDEMPIRLISLKDMSLVGRGDVRMHFYDRIVRMAATVPEVNEKDSREEAIKSLVRKVAQYAILSHRWLEQGEPTYQEMLTQQSPVGPGYDKLAQFCHAARQYGMEYAWSDTCCIDKTSSSELDESIRSMFKWYKTAHVCIVYLAQTTSIGNMPRDPWFTRGWTLQELLAPEKLKFFGAQWISLTGSLYDIDRGNHDKSGAHTALFAAVASGSGIREEDILSFLPGATMVHIRMSWASKRRTTRGEDRAYSLMGIFDVTFPIVYGEGLQRAFCRLLEAIMQNSPKTEVLNWAGDPSDSQISRAIPSSPDCYNHPVSTAMDLKFRSRQHLSLTSMGLRVSLLILPLHPLTPIHQHDLAFRCDAYGIGDIAVRSKFTGKWSIRALDPRWALGVYNYFEQPDGCHLERLSVAYLLASTLVGWTKIPTENIISFEVPNCNDSGYLPANDSEIVRMDI